MIWNVIVEDMGSSIPVDIDRSGLCDLASRSV